MTTPTPEPKKTFLDMLKELFTSKKWYMVIIGSGLVSIMSHFGVPDMAIQLIAGLFGVGVYAQGQADKGSVAAKIENQ